MHLLLLLVASVFCSVPAEAYPSYVRLGYVSCSACHVSSQGAGLLTEYGKGVAAGSALFSRELKSGLVAPNVNLGLHARALYLKNSAKSEFFPMQLDGMASVGSAGLRGDLVVGYTPRRQKNAGRAGKGALGEDFILRKALLARKHTDSMEWVVGRDASPGGILTDDHTAFIRSLTRRGVTDYPTQARVDLSSESWLQSYSLLAPSFEESASAREYGVSARVEKILSENASAGGFALYGKSDSIERLALSAFTRFGVTSATALVSEVQMTSRWLSSGHKFDQWIVHARPSYAILEWLELGLPIEALSISSPFQDLALQTGPSANLRLVGEASLLVDSRWTIRGGRTQGLFLAQVFVHL